MLTNNACISNSRVLVFAGFLAAGLVLGAAAPRAQESAAVPVAKHVDSAPAQTDLTPTAVPQSPAVQPPAKEKGAISDEPVQDAAVDPCPMPSTDMAKTPDDLAKVQADIDRYTLCMERAQLLQRLNDLATENQEKLNEANGVSEKNPGMQLDKLPSFEDQKAQIMASIKDQGEGNADTAAPPPASGEWQIMSVTGSNGGLSARLGKSDGTLSQVKAGEELPDGSLVEKISPTSVSIKQDGASKNLHWVDDTQSDGTGKR